MISQDANDALPFITAYADALQSSISALAAEGADYILVPNVPDIGKTPALLAAGAVASATATAISSGFNAAGQQVLAGLKQSLGIHLIELDVFSMMSDLTMFGFTDVTHACAANQSCIDNPDSYFFWDGIHPTTAGYDVIARQARSAIPEPATLLLLCSGILLLGRRTIGGHTAK